MWQNQKIAKHKLWRDSYFDKTQIVAKLNYDTSQILKKKILNCDTIEKQSLILTTWMVTKLKILQIPIVKSCLVRKNWQLNKLMKCTQGSLLRFIFFCSFACAYYLSMRLLVFVTEKVCKCFLASKYFDVPWNNRNI